MKLKLISIWEATRTSYWFVPALLASLATLLSFGTITLDEMVSESTLGQSWAYSGGPEGARAVLSVVAGSMITVAGVVFSITIVALSLASSQFGPRLLRNFMKDTANQVVLGTFTATFLYCLLVLRTVRGDSDNVFVPHFSVTAGVLLGVASLGVLIYFIHHVSVSIQATQVIAAVSADLHVAINWLFPEELGGEPPGRQEQAIPPGLADRLESESRPVAAEASGYLQAIDNDSLLEVARAKDLVLRLNYRPGHFIVKDTDIVEVWPGEAVDEQLCRNINATFVMGEERTPTQDVEFAVNQLVEVALRALSPGVNDPFTAIACIDRLCTALCHLARRHVPSPYRHDAAGKLRVIADPVTFGGIADAAFNQIRQAGRSNTAVTIRLLETIAIVAACARRDSDRVALQRHAGLIWQGSQQALPEQQDQSDVEARYKKLQWVLDRVAKSPRP